MTNNTFLLNRYGFLNLKTSRSKSLPSLTEKKIPISVIQNLPSKGGFSMLLTYIPVLNNVDTFWHENVLKPQNAAFLRYSKFITYFPTETISQCTTTFWKWDTEPCYKILFNNELLTLFQIPHYATVTCTQKRLHKSSFLFA